MDELIVDRNTIEISTKSTSTIGIVTIHFHLQHMSRLLQVSHLNNILCNSTFKFKRSALWNDMNGIQIVIQS